MFTNRSLFSLIIFLGSVFSGWCLESKADSTLVVLKAELANAKDSDSRLMALLNLYDYTRWAAGTGYPRMVYEAAAKSGNTDLQLEVLRNLASVYVSTDSAGQKQQNVYDACLMEAEKFPDTPEKRETVVLIKLRKYMSQLRKNPVMTRKENLPRLIENFVDFEDDNIYDRVLKLYKLTMALSYSVGGQMYSDYMSRLQTLINGLPSGSGDLKSMFYSDAARAYSLNDKAVKSVNADEQLMQIYQANQRKFNARGRRFYDFDNMRFTSYQRMLGNNAALSSRNIEKYNDSIKVITQRSPRAAQRLNTNPRAKAYYLFATGEYAGALHELKALVDLPQNRDVRRKMLKMMITCADTLNDKHTLNETVYAYNQELTNYITQNLEGDARDMQLFFKVSEIKDARLSKLAHESEAKIASFQKIIMIMAIISGVLLVIVVWLIAFRRKQHIATHWYDGTM